MTIAFNIIGIVVTIAGVVIAYMTLKAMKIENLERE